MDSRLARAALACALATALFAAQPGPAAAGTVALSVPTWESDYDWSHGDGYAGWRTATTAADPAAYGFAAGLPGLPGLWLWPTGGREYHPGTAEWSFDAPGTTRIADATIGASYDEKLFAHHCLGASLDSASEERASFQYCKPPQAGPKHVLFELSDPSALPLSKEAHLVVEMPPCRNPAETPCSKYIPQLDPLVDGPFARGTHVHLVLVDDDRPTASASGPLRDGVNGYVNGHRSYDVTLSASDPGAGVRKLGLVGPDGSHVLADDVTCDPTHNTPELGSRLCPQRSETTHSVDLSNVPEGAAWFHADAEDLATNGDAEAPWRVFVDRTAPPAPHDFDVDLDGETDTANVNWVADDDPALADGSPGSGLATWTYRFYHPRLGWSDWHTGTESIEVPQSFEGDEIKVEARSVDAVGNESELASATLQIPVEDDEESFLDNLDDDQPEPPDADVPDASDARASAVAADASPQTMTLEFQAMSLSERRDAALARVRQECTKGVRKIRCYDAVQDACHIGGICTTAKKIACSQVGLYCSVADPARVSLVAQYQPTFRMDKSDRFWPVSFSTALKERWDGRSTCYVRDDNCVASGYDDVRHLIKNMDHQVDGLHLDYPAHWKDIDDQFHSETDALGLPRIDTDVANTNPQWDAVYKTARLYWYRGGGFGSNTGTAKSLQYWTYLTYNYLPSSFGVQDHHEGDIEMVAVVLDANNQPVWLFQSRHGTNLKKEARRFLWNGGAFQKFDTHPIVYSAHGSHAMYESCGKHSRTLLPDDHVSCEDTDLLNFTFFGTRRISLGRSSWACWGGKLGNSSSTIAGGGSPPSAPLWQEGTFHGDPNPCSDASPASASAASASHLRTRAHAAQQPGQDPIVEQFARCEDWYQAPTQPGTTIVACDQAQLDHYIASGLTDPGPGGAVVVGPDGRSNDVPSVYSSEDPRGLSSARVIGSGSSAGVYAAALGVDGTLRTAAFPATTLPQGMDLHIHWNGAAAQLVSPTGRVIATARVATKHGPRFATLAAPHGLKARRVRRRVTVSWLAAAATSYSVSSGRSRAAAGTHLLRSIKRGVAGRRRVAVRMPRGDHWIGLRAVRGSTTSRMVAVRVR